MSSFFSELRRRNVFRVGLAYVIVTWLLLQVVDVVAPMLVLPDWVGKLILLLLGIGFPVALIFAWAFELTPEGLKREMEVDRSQSITPRTGRKLDFFIIGVLAVAVVVLAVTHDWGAERDVPVQPAPAGPSGKTIVVLPFENISADPEQEYFVSGMHDALIAELARIADLSVISRTSANRFKDTDLTIPEIARKLNVGTVVEGSVFKSGDQVRIQAQLIDAVTDEHLWANTYDRNLRDILTLHKEVTRDIANQIQATLTSDVEHHLAVKREVDPEAHRLYLQGMQLLGSVVREPLERSIELIEEAIRIQPDFALAHYGRSFAYMTLSGSSFAPRSVVIPEARKSAQKALELAPYLGEAYSMLGWIAFFEWDWLAAENHFRKALKLSPSDTATQLLYANVLTAAGRLDEAITISTRLMELDPFNVGINVNHGRFYYHKREYDKALAVFDEILVTRPTATYANWARGMTLLQLGRYEDALADFDRCVSCPWAYGVAYGMMGRTDEAREVIDTYLERAENEFIFTSFLTFLYAAVGDNDEAFKWLEKTYADKESWLAYLPTEPLFDPLRDDPRFDDLVRRMNFPPAPQ